MQRRVVIAKAASALGGGSHLRKAYQRHRIAAWRAGASIIGVWRRKAARHASWRGVIAKSISWRGGVRRKSMAALAGA